MPCTVVGKVSDVNLPLLTCSNGFFIIGDLRARAPRLRFLYHEGSRSRVVEYEVVFLGLVLFHIIEVVFYRLKVYLRLRCCHSHLALFLTASQ